MQLYGIVKTSYVAGDNMHWPCHLISGLNILVTGQINQNGLYIVEMVGKSSDHALNPTLCKHLGIQIDTSSVAVSSYFDPTSRSCNVIQHGEPLGTKAEFTSIFA